MVSRAPARNELTSPLAARRLCRFFRWQAAATCPIRQRTGEALRFPQQPVGEVPQTHKAALSRGRASFGAGSSRRFPFQPGSPRFPPGRCYGPATAKLRNAGVSRSRVPRRSACRPLTPWNGGNRSRGAREPPGRSSRKSRGIGPPALTGPAAGTCAKARRICLTEPGAAH